MNIAFTGGLSVSCKVQVNVMPDGFSAKSVNGELRFKKLAGDKWHYEVFSKKALLAHAKCDKTHINVTTPDNRHLVDIQGPEIASMEDAERCSMVAGVLLMIHER